LLVNESGNQIICDCRSCTTNFMRWTDLNKILSTRVKRRIKEVIVE